jgi:hypothetical protein
LASSTWASLNKELTMDVSLRQWPLFITGLLLGAAGTMSLGLHRPTEAELAAATPRAVTPAVAPVAAASAPAIDQAALDAANAARADEQMRAAAEAFRLQEVLASASLAPPPKPRVRRVVKEEAPVVATAVSGEAPIAIAPNTAAAPAERSRPATSTMGAAPAAEQVQAARGSAHAADVSDAGRPSE